MRVAALVENTTIDKQYRKKHGLCLYIETVHHKVLFDLGPDDTFLHNAGKMGIDVREVDTVVISHGHVDHGGALARFLLVNKKARIFIHEAALEAHYLKVAFVKFSVGISSSFAGNERVVLIHDTLRIDDELLLFADVDGQFESRSNRTLFAKTAGGYGRDSFAHEQNLIVMQQGKTVLFSGCSHRGIGNIIKAAQKHVPRIDTAVGGFHLFSPAKITEPSSVVQGVAKELAATGIRFYTCHCTGTKAYGMMKEMMADKLAYLSTGMDIADI